MDNSAYGFVQRSVNRNFTIATANVYTDQQPCCCQKFYRKITMLTC